ncbi:MAG TPA: anti-sigma F factor [Firmicutes bacterium]|nr:anti-sigma F factor [Bacillota bacterium]
MRLEIPSRSENEAFARVVVAAFASRLDPTLEEISDLKTAVSEAVTNAIIHAYEDQTGLIVIVASLEGNKLTVEIADFGVGIENIEQARQPFYTSKPELERSGMGFTIMENFMDEIAVKSEKGRGTTVVLAKYIRSKDPFPEQE